MKNFEFEGAYQKKERLEDDHDRAVEDLARAGVVLENDNRSVDIAERDFDDASVNHQDLYAERAKIKKDELALKARFEAGDRSEALMGEIEDLKMRYEELRSLSRHSASEMNQKIDPLRSVRGAKAGSQAVVNLHENTLKEIEDGLSELEEDL